MLAARKCLHATQVPQRREQIEREVAAIDRQIDALVYTPYVLSDAEIAIVEEAIR